MTRGPGWRKCTAYRQPGPRGTPLGLGLNEGLGTAVLTTGRTAGDATDRTPTTSWGTLTWRGGSLSSCIGISSRGGFSCKQVLRAFVPKELMRGHSRSRTSGLRRVVGGGAGAEHGTDCLQNDNIRRSARVVVTVWVALVFKDDLGEKSQHEKTGGRFWRCLTFELSGRRRQDASARTEKMYRVPQAGRWWPAVGAPLERGVRPRWMDAHLLTNSSTSSPWWSTAPVLRQPR